eukprot:1755324-Prymnesium_polylepis.1
MRGAPRWRVPARPRGIRMLQHRGRTIILDDEERRLDARLQQLARLVLLPSEQVAQFAGTKRVDGGDAAVRHGLGQPRERVALEVGIRGSLGRGRKGDGRKPPVEGAGDAPEIVLAGDGGEPRDARRELPPPRPRRSLGEGRRARQPQ